MLKSIPIICIIFIIKLFVIQSNCSVEESTDSLGLSLLNEIFHSQKGKENIFISPFSISSVLSMIYHGSDGRTREELARVLNYFDSDEGKLKVKWDFILRRVNSEEQSFQLYTANAMYVERSFDFLNSYKGLLTSLYHAKCQSIDFHREETVTIINKWISEKTRGKIDNFFSNIDPNTVMLLLNAIYFKGQWLRPFDKKDTKDDEFKNFGTQPVRVPIMKAEKQSLDYFLDNQRNVEILGIPYSGNDLLFYIILPKYGDHKDMKHLLDVLSTTNLLDKYLNSMNKTDCDIWLPRFKSDTKYELSDHLTQMGLRTLFTPDANLIMITGQRDLYVSQFQHKAVIDVNEEGTEAAAVSAAEIMLFSSLSLDSIEFRVNRPFIYFIRQKSTQTTLFLGIINKLG